MMLSDKMIKDVWEKARGMPDRDADEWRQDRCGAWLHWQQYNNMKSEYGWKILGVKPGSRHKLENLQPFHCGNDFDIGNDKPLCRVTADHAGLLPDPPRNIL